jgi:putative membrane protein
VQTYFEGDSGLVNGSKALTDGVNQLDAALNAGVTDAEKQQAQTAVDAMFATDGETYQGIKQQAAGQYKAAMTGSSELKTSVESGVSQAMYGAYVAAYQQLNAQTYAAAGKTNDELNNDAAAFASQMIQASAGSVSNVSDQLISGIAEGTSEMVGNSVAGACKDAALTGVESGIASTKSSIASQIEAGGLVDGANALSSGIDQLYVQGIQPLAVGMQTLSNSVPELLNGINTLNNGAAALNQNSAALKNGVNTLNAGGSELKNGAATLNNSSTELKTGAGTLEDGAKTLSDGMVQFDQEGIQKLSDAYHGDVESLLDRVDQVLDAGESYHSFSGLRDDMSGSVKFIIRTEEIGE